MDSYWTFQFTKYTQSNVKNSFLFLKGFIGYLKKRKDDSGNQELYSKDQYINLKNRVDYS